MPESAQERRTAPPEGDRMGRMSNGALSGGWVDITGYVSDIQIEHGPADDRGLPMTGDPDDYWPSENTRRGIFGQPETHREATCLCRTMHVASSAISDTYQIDMSGCPAHASNPIIDGEATDA